MDKVKLLAILFIILLLTNGIIYYVTELNKQQRVKISIDINLKNLETHFDILRHHQKIVANAVYESTIVKPDFIKIFSQIKNANKQKKDNLRKKLYQLLKNKYKIMQAKGVLQYQFVLPSNRSFLRMHKPSKYGDDLTTTREDFKYTNKTKEATYGFVQGRTTHGFRNIYPIFNTLDDCETKGEYLGAMEVSYSSEHFQKYLNNESKIHTHFIINKQIFDSKTWQRDDLIVKYLQSSEHKDYMLAMSGIHTKKRCIIDNQTKLLPIRKEIDLGISKGEKFAVYTVSDNIEIISFFPIKNMDKGKTLAWLVSYEKSDFLNSTFKGNLLVRTVAFIIFLLMAYLIYKKVLIEQIVKKDHKLLNDILSSTDDIIFVTDFKAVIFSNKRFKDFFNVEDDEEFNNKMNNQLLYVFSYLDNYLHEGLLLQGETFPKLIARTNKEEQVVSILDDTTHRRAFNINITKTSDIEIDEYLVTLTDITKLKEKEKEIQKKAYIDGLTNVYNRNKFDEIIKHELKRDIRYKGALSVAIVDIDHFKNFNDTYGHLVGDEVLIMLAQYLNNNVRDTDTFARWGGEEFVILFPQTNKDDVKNVCEKLRKGVEELSHPTAGGITASFGIAQYVEGDTLETIFKRCDDSLYKAKENGRNMVCTQ